MFSRIVVPVDLEEIRHMDKALTVAADLAKIYGAEAYVVGVTQSAPTKVARTPEAFAEKLSAFAAERSEALGVTFTSRSEISHDITIDLDAALERTVEALGADLIVMASHVPGFVDNFFGSNAGYLASHSTISVLVVR